MAVDLTETSRQQRREAEEVGCFGLIGGAARTLHTGELVYAAGCTKADGPFYCGTCYSDAVVRKCTEKRDHFAHKEIGRASCRERAEYGERAGDAEECA